jgi:hypothetical protein
MLGSIFDFLEFFVAASRASLSVLLAAANPRLVATVLIATILLLIIVLIQFVRKVRRAR